MNIKDLDAAISQMLYIAEPDQIDFIKSATTNAEKERRFMKFWKDNDPNPNTVKNETMEEYYRRVRIATERYSQYVEGWRTDMGMVYIIYGDPSNIERHPFNSDSRPYEVWDYYDINKQFVFVDYTGFGDYRLVTPIWDKRFKVR
jgi:GWxTD domain-containing protein